MIEYKDTELAYQHGRRISEENGVHVMGMSPGNSYFTKERITELFSFAHSQYSNLHIMIPDVPTKYSYEGMGYEPHLARRKAKRRSNNLRNRCLAAREKLGLEDAITFIDWSETSQASSFQSSLNRMNELYVKDELFRKDVRQTTRDVLLSQKKRHEDLEVGVDIAVRYLIEELAFLDEASEVFDGKSVNYLYHRKWPILEKYIAGEYGDKIERKKLGMLRVASDLE